jgi:hypothetical protein
MEVASKYTSREYSVEIVCGWRSSHGEPPVVRNSGGSQARPQPPFDQHPPSICGTGTKRAGIAVILSMLLLIDAAHAAESVDDAVIHKKTPDGIEYGVWGNVGAEPAPTLFMLAGTIDGTLGSAYFRQCGNELGKLGYVVVSIDLPCHGTQTAEGQPAGLSGWSHRVGNGEDHFAAHDTRVKCAAGFSAVTDLAALSEFRTQAG